MGQAIGITRTEHAAAELRELARSNGMPESVA